MRQLQLYINNERVDLFKDESVSLTQTIQNVKDIAKVFTEFTQTFSVPASKNNNKIFSHYYNSNIQGGFDARTKKPAYIEINNTPFKDGKIKLNKVSLKNNVAHTYHITFFGNVVDLKDILGDDLLSSLSDLNVYSQVYDFNNITDYIQNYAPNTNSNICVPLITHTDRMIYNGNASASEYGNVAVHSGINQNGINWNQFKYALRLQAIIEAIETKYTIANGYATDIIFSDDFFNDATNEEFHNLFMWLHRKKGDVESTSFGEAEYTLYEGPHTQIPFGQYGDMPTLSSFQNGQLIINKNPGIDFGINDPKVTLTLSPVPSGPPPTPYDVRVTGDNGYILISNTTGGLQIPINGIQPFANGTYALEIRSDVLVQFAAGGIRWKVEYEFRDEDFTTLSGGITYENSQTFSTSSVRQFNITEQIPKMKIIDFLSGLFKLFNLTAYVDELGVLVVRTLDSYYAANSKAPIVIDEFIDVTKSDVEIALPFKEISFSYKGLGTLLAKQFEQIFNSGWGSTSFTLNNLIYDAPTEDYKVIAPFEHMQFERLFDLDTSTSNIGNTTIQYGFFVDDNFESYYGDPLIFYPILNSGTEMKIIDTEVQGEEIEIDEYFIPSNTLALQCGTSETSIHFQSEISEYLAREPGDPNCFIDSIFETKYKTYIQDVFSNRRRLVKVSAVLPLKIYYDLELNNLIEMNQETYKINSLTTDLTTGKTEFELLNTLI